MLKGPIDRGPASPPQCFCETTSLSDHPLGSLCVAALSLPLRFDRGAWRDAAGNAYSDHQAPRYGYRGSLCIDYLSHARWWRSQSLGTSLGAIAPVGLSAGPTSWLPSRCVACVLPKVAPPRRAWLIT
jgi:hypothetical protein